MEHAQGQKKENPDRQEPWNKVGLHYPVMKLGRQGRDWRTRQRGGM